jgi:hypothetical protein
MTQKTPSPFDEITISVLNRIFDFAAQDAKDAILRLGLVSRQWQDTLLYCPSMWERLVEQKWPGSTKTKRFYAAKANSEDEKPAISATTGEKKAEQSSHNSGVNRWSLQSYRMRHITKTRADNGKTDFAEIENCAPDFQFVCPILVSNLTVLTEKDKKGRSLLFCDICSKRVYAVESADEVREASAEERCVYMPESLRFAIQASEGKLINNKEIVAEHDNGSGSKMEVINVAIVVDSEWSTDIINLNKSPTDILRLVCAKMSEKFYSEEEYLYGRTPKPQSSPQLEANRPQAKPNNVNDDDDDDDLVPTPFVGNVPDLSPPPGKVNPMFRADGPQYRFLSKNALDIYMPRFSHRNVLVSFRIVTVKPAPTEINTLKCFKKENHPAQLPGDQKNDNVDLTRAAQTNPLNGSAMPSNGGWQHVFFATKSASQWFTEPHLNACAAGSPVYSLYQNSLSQDGNSKQCTWIADSDGSNVEAVWSFIERIVFQAGRKLRDVPIIPQLLRPPVVAGGLMPPPYMLNRLQQQPTTLPVIPQTKTTTTKTTTSKTTTTSTKPPAKK